MPAETCDDGNSTSWDGCSATCTIEPVVTWMPPSWLCTVQSYPQVEVGEYLPIRWIWSSSQHTITQQTCSAIPFPGNGIKRDSIIWDLEIYRGWTEWLESVGSVEDVKIAEFNTTSAWMITDAIKDFWAEWASLLWTHLVEPSQIETWVNNLGTEKYGQYLMRLPEINYSYCAWSRTNIWTATGHTNVLTYTENCSNNFDDNGNGLVDCADTAFCATEENCIVWNWWWGWPYIPEDSCTDNQDTQDSHPWIDCADPSCYSAPNCLATVRPEHCANGLDDDGDGYIDCADSVSCWNVPYCKGTWTENGMTLCSDGDDNDNDWLIDCNDPQCMSTVMWCASFTAWICTDSSNNEPVPGQTNWQDGDYFLWFPLIDFSDPQCFLSWFNGTNQTSPIIFPETNCYDTSPAWWHPTLTNCADPTCQFFAVCGVYPFDAQYLSSARTINPLPETCNDGDDNDGDWFIDCSDFHCKTSIECGYQSWGWWSQWETACSDGDDNDDDWRIDCTDGECSTAPACTLGVNENCLNETINDDNDQYVLDADDPDCVRWYQFEEWYEPVSPLNTTTKNYTYTWSNGYVCEAGFSVSKWYFVQQWFAFSEEANAWLDASDFVSIGWVPLVTEWTVLDDGENNVSTYSQQWAKAYLFSGFIDTRELKATNNVRVGSDNWLIFKKVPNAHIYFWQWEEPVNWVETLELDEYDRDLLLRKWWVPDGEEETTPYTIVLPWSSRQWSPKQVLDIQWSLLWNAMYVSQGDIRFSSSQWSCDFSDSVEWLFIAAGEFTTTPINNKNPNATRRCKWWNLKIRGTLLWSNAWSSLAPLRRSVIDARNPNATFFDNSLVFKAKELFETCYLPALAMKKWNSIKWTPYTSSTWPLSNCNIDLLNTAANRENTINTSRWVRDDFLWLFTNPWNILATALTCTDPTPTSLCQKSIAFVYEMMDSVQNANSLFVIPKTIKKINALWSNPELIVTIEPSAVESFLNNPQTLLWKMQANSKRFPARWFAWMTNMPSPPVWQNYVQVIEDVIFTPDEKPKMMNDVSKAFGGIKDHFIGFSSPLVKVNTQRYWSVSNINSIVWSLRFVFWNEIANPSSQLRNISLMPANIWSLCPAFTPWIGYNITASNQAICQMSYYPDFKWIVDNKQSANTQWTTLASNIVDGSSVVISSQPKLWTDLPPGAKDFLNNIVVVPR